MRLWTCSKKNCLLLPYDFSTLYIDFPCHLLNFKGIVDCKMSFCSIVLCCKFSFTPIHTQMNSGHKKSLIWDKYIFIQGKDIFMSTWPMGRAKASHFQLNHEMRHNIKGFMQVNGNQGCAVVELSVPWCPTFARPLESLLFSCKSYAGYPGFYVFRALGYLQFFFGYSLVKCTITQMIPYTWFPSLYFSNLTFSKCLI